MSKNGSKYPSTQDPSFYKYINKRYARFTIPTKHKTQNQICFPKKYELQLPQKFLAEFINPDTPYRGLLVYHQIGSGKTCTAIRIAEKFKEAYQIIIVLPASLRDNFQSELRTECTKETYLKSSEREKLKSLYPSDPLYKEIIKTSDERINRVYTILSYNKFIDLIKANEINFKRTLLIIDEVHNMISTTGTYYELLYEALKNRPKDMRIVLMTATPIFDKPVEIALTMNLLLPDDRQVEIGPDFVSTYFNITYRGENKLPQYVIKNLSHFKELIRGYVSYFRGAQPNVFPESKLHIVKCPMSKPQYQLYNRVMGKEVRKYKTFDYVNTDIPNSFYLGTRMVSNFMFPNQKINEEGFESLEDSHLDPDKLEKYSLKFLKILRKVNNCSGTIFIYSNFKEYGGIKVLARMLDCNGYRDYNVHGHGRKRYAIWSGDEKPTYKSELKAVFNRPENADGSQLKIIMGSPSLKEGVSLLRVQQVHILEPYWNMSRILQIVGRAVRFCSHKDVDIEKRLVKIYIYLAVHEDLKESIDQRIMRIALNKRSVNLEFERALKEDAIDCTLFYNGNVYRGDQKLVCEV